MMPSARPDDQPASGTGWRRFRVGDVATAIAAATQTSGVMIVLTAMLVAGPVAGPVSGKDNESGKGSGSTSISSSGSSGSGSSAPGSSAPGSSRDDDDDRNGSSVPSLRAASVPTQSVPTQTAPSDKSVPSVPASKTPTTLPLTTPRPLGTKPSSASNRPSPAARLDRSVVCGKTSIQLRVRSDGRTIELGTRVKPEKQGPWDATVIRDRTIVWRGQVERGRVERTFADLPGAEHLTVRLRSKSGSNCSVSATLPG